MLAVYLLRRLGLEKTDLVDRIMLELTDKSKNRRQIIKELKNQDLIKNTKDLKLYETILFVSSKSIVISLQKERIDASNEEERSRRKLEIVSL